MTNLGTEHPATREVAHGHCLTPRGQRLRAVPILWDSTTTFGGRNPLTMAHGSEPKGNLSMATVMATVKARRAWNKGEQTLAVFQTAFPLSCTAEFDGECRCNFSIPRDGCLDGCAGPNPCSETCDI